MPDVVKVWKVKSRYFGDKLFEDRRSALKYELKSDIHNVIVDNVPGQKNCDVETIEGIAEVIWKHPDEILKILQKYSDDELQKVVKIEWLKNEK